MAEVLTAKAIAKSSVQEWLRRLLQHAEVIAPLRVANGDVTFAPLAAPEQACWEFENSLYPPKQFLLPHTEPLVHISRQDGRYQVEPAPEPRRRILFNARSCDVTALAFLRQVHAEEPADTATLRRADALTVVSLACTTPCTDGFCVCCDAGPFLHGGVDVQLTDLGDRLLAEPGSAAGQSLLDIGGPLFGSAADADIELRGTLEEVALRGFGEQTCHLGSAMRRVSTGRVSQTLWEKMADHCFECGGCTFVCPTCYCFSVRDRSAGDGWERCRLWDSCQYSAFTLEASGHNPREHRRDRVKRRFFHKASAQYYQRDGRADCVGCGRCVRVCLGDLSLPTGVAAIRRGAWHG